MNAWAVIPTLQERNAIGKVVDDLVGGTFGGIIVVDGGSSDGTPEAAREAGARVIIEPRSGYGRAVMSGVGAARAAGADAFAIFDGNGTIVADDVQRVVAELAAGGVDLVVGCRDGAELRPLQRLGNRFAVELIARFYRLQYRDLGSLRAITAPALSALELDELGHGWPLQLQLRAAARGLRVSQLPISLGRRRSRSKVSGTVRGSVRASLAFLRVLSTELRP
jgi:glycosyltransferase involved in cell wall biosynthesis